MSILMKVMATVAKIIPDRGPDQLGESGGYVGQPLDRIDGRAKVTGVARFSAEYALEGLTYAALVYSTIAKGQIATIDAAAAIAAPGVIAVITHENALKMKAPPLGDPTGGAESAGSSVNVLNTADVSWNGQPVAMVVADTVERAEFAASLVVVTYREASAVTIFQDAKLTQKKLKSIMGEDAEISAGDVDAALRSAPFKIDAAYVTPFYNHNAIEPHATTAVWDEDQLTVFSGTQNVQGEAATLAKIFGIKADEVHVVAPFVGGGFGGKGAVWSHVQLCALAAKMVQRPVRLALTREGVFRIVGGRTLSEQRVALGADASGKIVSIIHSGVTANSPNNEFPEQFTFPARHLYAMESYLITQSVARLNMMANTFMRAPGESIGSFALESALDELAGAIGIDPIELRIRNEPPRDPTKGTEFSSRHLVDAYRIGAAKFGWQQRVTAVGAQRDGHWLVGQGMATAYYPVYRLQTAVRIRINADGSVLVQTSAQEMGMGTATVQTQHVADRLGVRIEQVRFEYGDSTLPPAGQAGGSSQTVSIALAIVKAHEKLQRELLQMAKHSVDSPLADADVDDVEARDGGLFLKARPAIGLTYAAIIGGAAKPMVEVEVKTGPALETLKYSMHSYGAHFCEVRVNDRTGEVRISRWVGAFDVGRVLNPKTARSQLMGGIIMGIGMALTEETLIDERTGRIMNPSLAEYHVPVNADVPKIEVYFTDIADPHTPLGAHGVGEIGITGAAAAIANAVYHATGKRIRSLPISLDKLL